MLVVSDIGNSNIVIALWDEGSWKHHWRLETHPVQDAAAYRGIIHSFFDEAGIETTAISSAIISSVVPPATQPCFEAFSSVFGVDPILLKTTTETGITLGVDAPDRVGTDLIADAVAAYQLVNDTCVIVDLGTATTVMTVKKPGILSGGAICAGLRVSVDALVGKTAQLPKIPLTIPRSPLGKNTVEAMQSGLVLGHLCMVEGLIDRIKNELGPAKVVATGGLVEVLATHTDYFNYVEPMLTLDGLRLIAERHADGKGER